jgi:hypothetical protein
MSVKGKRRFRSIVEEAISSKIGIAPITAQTLRSDAAAILESVLGELNEESIVNAMRQQGFEADAYRSSIRSLGAVARQRRALRNYQTK